MVKAAGAPSASKPPIRAICRFWVPSLSAILEWLRADRTGGALMAQATVRAPNACKVWLWSNLLGYGRTVRHRAAQQEICD